MNHPTTNLNNYLKLLGEKISMRYFLLSFLPFVPILVLTVGCSSWDFRVSKRSSRYEKVNLSFHIDANDHCVLP